MRLLHGKQGLRRSQFAKEFRGTDLKKVLLVPIDVSKVLQNAMILNYFDDVTRTVFLHGQPDWNVAPYYRE